MPADRPQLCGRLHLPRPLQRLPRCRRARAGVLWRGGGDRGRRRPGPRRPEGCGDGDSAGGAARPQGGRPGDGRHALRRLCGPGRAAGAPGQAAAGGVGLRPGRGVPRAGPHRHLRPQVAGRHPQGAARPGAQCRGRRGHVCAWHLRGSGRHARRHCGQRCQGGLPHQPLPIPHQGDSHCPQCVHLWDTAGGGAVGNGRQRI
mmetsp:Transcript_2533/g.6638  ORF Transcript_2533/g.6638 Transcript_2533/m.6638 type:complete len:202 (+) Transcript_2533:117-722(+)